MGVNRDLIISMLQEGKTYKEIIEKTGSSKGTISYHAQRLGNPNRKKLSPEALKAKDLIRAHRTNSEIMALTGLSITRICQLRKELGISSVVTWDKTDWQAFQKLYDTGLSIRECSERFGIPAKSAFNAVNRGKIRTRPNTMIPIETVLVENSTYQRGNLKRRLLADGHLKNECQQCGHPPEWMGRPLVLILDHINGVNNDNRIENLRFLCPNCNSQTSTFSGKNTKRARMKLIAVPVVED